MSELRQKFEELPDIKGIIYGSDFGFNESLNQYYHPDHTNHRLNYAFIMGAWCAFQSRQAEIDQLKAQLALCREENKGLVGSLNKQRKHHRESANKLTQKSIRLTDAEFEYKRIKGLQAKDCLQIMRLTARNEKLHDELKALRGERE